MRDKKPTQQKQIMARILMIVAQNGFRDEELLVPKAIFERAGHQVKTASILRSKASGSKGALINVDFGISELNPDFFDAVIVVGGPDSPTLASNPQVIKFIEKANSMKKIMGAICLGPMTLANAGVLAGKNATVFPDIKGIRAIRENGGIYFDKKVIEDELVITANGPEAAEEFAKAILNKLKK
jgi:protease I